MIDLLDCGHPPDTGHPATVKQADGTYATVQGWTSVLRDGRRICHACDMLRVLDCGHHPSTHSHFTTGTAHTPDGREICYECATLEDKAAMESSSMYYGYLASDCAFITNWPGQHLARVTYWHKIRHNWARTLIAWRAVDATGTIWYGRCAGPGMATRMRKAKEAA